MRLDCQILPKSPSPPKLVGWIRPGAHARRLAGKAVDFTLLRHNNARSGKIYIEISIGPHFPLV